MGHETETPTRAERRRAWGDLTLLIAFAAAVVVLVYSAGSQGLGQILLVILIAWVIGLLISYLRRR